MTKSILLVAELGTSSSIDTMPSEFFVLHNELYNVKTFCSGIEANFPHIDHTQIEHIRHWIQHIHRVKALPLDASQSSSAAMI